MIRKLPILIITLLFFNTAFGQESIAFQHLRNATFQSTNYNPAWMPEGVLFVGLPALSGVNFYVNNKFSYNELFTNNESGGKLIDVNNAINKLAINNLVSLHANISLLHLGITTPSGHSLALFANERIESDVTYPKSLLDWAWDGNGTFIGRDVNFSNTGVTTNYFREYGLAYAVRKPEIGLKAGFRVKMYRE